MVRFTAEWTGHAVSENSRVVPGARGGKWRPNGLYSTFKDSMIWTLGVAKSIQKWETARGQVRVSLEVTCPAGMDHHNLLKPALDALQQARVVENDRDCVDVRIVRMGRAKESHIVFNVMISEEIKAFGDSFRERCKEMER